jgi:hypothetical protein
VTGTPDGHLPGTTPPATSTGLDPDPGLDPAELSHALDRCAADAPALPARELWQPVFGVRMVGTTAVAAVVEGKPLICQTTEHGVTVTDPDATPSYVGDTRTGVLLNSPDGVLAGVVDPTWGTVGVNLRDGATGLSIPADTRPGFFILVSDSAHLADQIRLYELIGDNSDPAGWDESLPIVAPPPPAVELVTGSAEATPDDAGLVGRCLAGTGTTGLEAGAGTPFRYDGRLVVLRNGQNFGGTCVYEPKSGYTYTENPADAVLRQATPVPDVRWHRPAHGQKSVAIGVLLVDAGSVRLHFATGEPVLLPVVNRTFVSPQQSEQRPVTSVQVYDRDDALLYEGPPAVR